MPQVTPKALDYIAQLKARDAWPPGAADEAPEATPFLVVRSSASDTGQHSRPPSEGWYSWSIRILDKATLAPTVAQKGNGLLIACDVSNFGGAASYAGQARFYLAWPADFDAFARGSAVAPRPFATLPFTVQPGQVRRLLCPWTPATDDEALSSIVVEAGDVMLDPPTHRFDALSDRHIGRLDHIPDFGGVWEGVLYPLIPWRAPVPTRIVISQVGATLASIVFYGQKNGVFANTPGDTFTNAPITGMTAQQSHPGSHTMFSDHCWLTLQPDGSLRVRWNPGLVALTSEGSLNRTLLP